MKKSHITKVIWLNLLVLLMASDGARATQASFKVDPLYAAEAANLKAKMEQSLKAAAERKAKKSANKEKVEKPPVEVRVVVNPEVQRDIQVIRIDPPVRVINGRPAQNQDLPVVPVLGPVVEPIVAPVVAQVLVPVIDPVVDQVVDPNLRQQNIREIIRVNIDSIGLRILRDAALEPVILFFAHHPLVGNDAHVFLKSFAKRVEAERRNAEHINNRVLHVRRTLEIANDLWPVEEGGRKYDPVLEVGFYRSALEEREQIYEYFQRKGLNILLDEVFVEVITLLKAKLKKLPHAVLDLGYTFQNALRITQFDEATARDKKRTLDCFDMKQLALTTRIDRAAVGRGFYTIMCGKKACDLVKEWDLCVKEIDRIDNARRNDPIGLVCQNLTYRDHYAAYFQVDYPDISLRDSDVLRDKILTIIRVGVPPDPDKPYRLETPDRVDIHGAVVEHGTYGREPKKRIYFRDDDGEITGRADSLYSLPKKSDGTRLYFLGKTKEYFRSLNGVDTGNFRARAKLLLEKVPPCMIPADIVRPGEDNFNQVKWDDVLAEARKQIAIRIVCSLEGCDTGKDDKLGKIERDYQEVLGVLRPEEPLMKSVAGVVRNLKRDRIYETQNPDKVDRFEESVTAPQVLLQRLRGPFGLLGDYMPIVGTSYGRPLDPQNSPFQIIKNMFRPGQPDRAYQIGPMPTADQEDKGDWVFVPVKPCMTVKSLVEAVYNEFQSVNPNGSIRTKDICSFFNGHLDLLQDEYSAAVNLRHGIFFHGLSDRNEKLFTREMAFYILERMEYVRLEERIKLEAYKFDHDDEPGKALVAGRRMSLKELIDEY